MTSLEHMSYLVDCDVCNISVPHACTTVVMVTGLENT